MIVGHKGYSLKAISVESSLGQGSTFSVRIPLLESSAEATTQSEIIAKSLHFLKDNPTNQEMMRVWFADIGPGVHQAFNGEEGIDKIRKLQSEGLPPDLVLMDKHMPKMDGLAATQRCGF